MSITTTMTVRCDYRSADERCETTRHGVTEEHMEARKTDARAAVLAAGWTYRCAPSRKAYDLCPVHRDDVPAATFPDWKAGPSA